jgi:hypothetical protein
MALRPKASFAGGELDPALQERTTLQKYDSGLKTGRNIFIGKTGRIASRAGRKLFIKTKDDDKRCILYYPKGSGLYLEWGDLYVRIYSLDATLTGVAVGTLIDDLPHAWTEANLDDIHFSYNNFYVYAFCTGKTPLKLFPFPGAAFITTTFDLPASPAGIAVTVTASTGYSCDYMITAVINGEESLYASNVTGYALPIAAGQSNKVVGTIATTASLAGKTFTEMKVYRRPHQGGAYGYIGSSAYIYTSGANTLCDFTDIGQTADYTHQQPTLTTKMYTRGISGPAAVLPTTGTVYQQRLVIANGEDLYLSRTGFQNNFTREYPLSDDSSLQIKCGSDGTAKILRIIDSDGMVIFTNVGIYVHTGQVGTSNLALPKKGDWIIDPRIPPLSVPGGVLFMDKATNVVRMLNWSTDYASFAGDELSVFSDHLFRANQVVSWGYQQGDSPLLWVIFEDGTAASFTYERGQQMQAWTRHDCSNDVNYEYVQGCDSLGSAIFLVEKDGKRYVEVTVPRYISANTKASDPEYNKNESTAKMDSFVTWKSLLNDDLVGADELNIVPVIAGDYSQDLTLTCGTSGLFPNTADNGAIGTIFRFFNPDDQTTVDLEVTARTSNNSVTVTPTATFPEDYDSGFRLYRTKDTFTGLDHMEGEFVSVKVDGYAVCSPNNDHPSSQLASVQVAAGSITLPGTLKGAIVHIGRPITADVETLDVDTVEQRPVLIESQTVNKVYVKLFESRGIFVHNEFPDDDKVLAMSAINVADVDDNGGDDAGILGNRYIEPVTDRFEVTLDGDWKSNGRVCMRHVDCDHFEILSIIPDTEDERR